MRRNYSGWTAERFKEEVIDLDVKSRSELQKKDEALYRKSLKEGWLGAVFGAGRVRRDYSGWTVERFKQEVEALNVKSRSELSKKDCGLYEQGRQEGWLDAVLWEPLRRDFSGWTVERFKVEVEALGVKSRSELQKNDSGLYAKGLKEGWLNNVFGKSGCKPSRDYSGWTTEKYKREVESLGVKSRKELEEKACGLYCKGLKEGWLDAAFGVGQVRRDFSGLTVERFKQMVETLDVKSRGELCNEDQGLYEKGLDEGWLHAVFGTGRVTRDYSGLTVEMYRREVEALGVKSRKELQKKAKGLYWKGGKEGWLDIVFPKSSGSLDAVLENYVAHESSIDSKVGEK